MVKITRQTATRLKKLLDPESTRRDKTPPGGGGTGYVPSGGDDPRIVIVTTDDIDPNTWGKFKFTEGAKGHEYAIGDEFDGYYRNDDPKAEPLTVGTFSEIEWIGSSDNSDLSGWEFRPFFRLRPAIRFVKAQSNITAGGSGMFKFQNAVGTPPVFTDTSEPAQAMTSPAAAIASGEVAYATEINLTHWEVQPRTCPT